VYAQYLAGQTNDIQNYCETDVMNTYLMYCRYQKMRGGFTEKEYDAEIEFVQSTLGELTPHAPHWQEYLAAWR
jgi:predicted PolB exonuclease-like 3'-5' exonuclease